LRQLEEILREQLGVEPGTEAVAIAASLRSGPLPPAAITGQRIPEEPVILEDRRIVTVLVADLPDPGDPDPERHAQRLRAQLDTIRDAIETAGGVVESNAGSRVVAVFGAPALGDDVRRACRAADAIGRLEPDIGVGISTGWALVRAAGTAAPRIVGPVVDAAARAVRAGSRPADCDDARAGEAVVAASTRRGAERTVGRGAELDALRERWDRVRRDGTMQLLLVTGEPGIGKSHLADALLAFARPDVARLLHCAPGSDSRPLAPVAALIAAELAERADVLEAIEPDRSAQAWLRRRLAPLIGAATGAGAEGLRLVEPSEIVAACARFVAGVAGLGPRLVVVEDLHWADTTTLDVLRRLAAIEQPLPLLLIGTTRPELLTDARGAALAAFDTLHLGAMPATEIDALLAGQLDARDRPAVVARSGGNPLFAIELARLVRDDRGPRGELPATVRSAVTARFDTLGRGERSVVRAIAVAGGATNVAELGVMLELDRSQVLHLLRSLAQREIVRFEGEVVDFVHDVVRETAAEQITRAAAVQLHRRLADWLASTGGTGASPVRIAAQYRRAALAARAIDHPGAHELRALAFRHLTAASDRLGQFDAAAALGHLDAARGVAPAPSAPAADLRRGQLLFALGRWPESVDTLTRTVAAAAAAGRTRLQAAATAMLAEVAWHAGDVGEAMRALERSLELAEGLAAPSEAAAVVGTQAALCALTGDAARAHALAERGLELARAAGSARTLVRCLEARGTARALDGDHRGYDDFVEALEVATAEGLSFEVCGIYGDFAAIHWLSQGPEASLAMSAKGLELATAHGLAVSADWLREVRARACIDAGRWDEALVLAGDVLGQPPGRQGQAATGAATWSARVHAWRGDVDRASELSAWSLRRARRHVVIQAVAPALVTAALAALGRNDRDAVDALLTRYLAATERPPAYRLMDLTTVTRLLVWLGRGEEAAHVAAGLEAPWVRGRLALATAGAVLATARGDPRAREAHAAAAAQWRRYGAPLEEALALAAAGDERRAREIAAGLGISLDGNPLWRALVPAP
jgi:tetratricopeptide (TPR) repeat protein